MKIKRLAAALAAIAALMCTTACSGKEKSEFYGNIFADSDFSVSVYRAAEELEEYDVRDDGRARIAYDKSGAVPCARVYDAASGQRVYEINGEGVRLTSVACGRAFAVTEGEESVVRRVCDGAILGSVGRTELSSLTSERDKIFRIGKNIVWESPDSGELELLIENDPFAAVPDLNFSLGCGKYFYGLSGHTLTVYDRSLAPIAEHTLDPGSSVEAFALSEGKVLIQETEPAEPDEEYDYVYGGKRMKKRLYVTDAEKKSTAAIDEELLVHSVKDGIAVVSRIGKDKRLCPEQTVRLSARLKTECVYTQPLGTSLTPHCKQNGKRYYETDNGYIVNEEGSFVVDTAAVTATKAYLIRSDGVYDYEKKLVLDLAANDLSVAAVTDKALALTSSKGEAYIFNGALTMLGKAGVKRKTGMLMIKTDDKYEYYNALGEKLLETDCELFYVRSLGDGAYFRSASYDRYWRFTSLKK